MNSPKVVALCALMFGLANVNCALESGEDAQDPGSLHASASTRQLVKDMSTRGKVFVFDKDKTLLGGDTATTKELLRLIRREDGNLAVLTSNTTMDGGEYKAIGQLQRRFGEDIFPDSFFESAAFQVNDKVGDRTKANEMADIIAYFGARDDDIVFYDDKASNISDVRAEHPGVVGIRVDPDRSMTESDFRRGMEERLGASGSSSCARRCSPSCPCAEGEGDCDRDEDCESGLVCPPNRPGAEQCEARDGSGGGGGGGGNSNLQVRLDGRFQGVCCSGGELEVSNDDCSWEEHGRRLETRDVRTGRATQLDCPENGQRPADCDCSSTGERMHGISDGDRHVENSLMLPNGAPIYPNSGHENCIDLVGGELQSRRTSSSCPNWRLLDFY